MLALRSAPCKGVQKSQRVATATNVSHWRTRSQSGAGSHGPALEYSQGKVSWGGLGRLNHVAIAVPNLQEAIHLYRDILGAKVSQPVDQKEHGVTTVFIDLGNTKLELLHPLGEKSPIQNFLTKNSKGGVHHVCIEVDDVDAAVKELTSTGGLTAIDPKPKIGAHGKPVVFMHPKSLNGVLVELEQK